MSAWLQANLSVVVFVAVFFVLTAFLALRTPSGRDALGAGAVRLALACLALAERWLGTQLQPVTLEDGRTVYRDGHLTLARVQLTAWLARSGDRPEQAARGDG